MISYEKQELNFRPLEEELDGETASVELLDASLKKMVSGLLLSIGLNHVDSSCHLSQIDFG